MLLSWLARGSTNSRTLRAGRVAPPIAGMRARSSRCSIAQINGKGRCCCCPPGVHAVLWGASGSWLCTRGGMGIELLLPRFCFSARHRRNISTLLPVADRKDRRPHAQRQRLISLHTPAPPRIPITQSLAAAPARLQQPETSLMLHRAADRQLRDRLALAHEQTLVCDRTRRRSPPPLVAAALAWPRPVVLDGIRGAGFDMSRLPMAMS